MPNVPPVRDCLPRKLSAIRCVRGGKRETAIVKQSSDSFHLKSCNHSVRDARDPRRCSSTCVRRALGKKRGGLGKKCILVGKKLNSPGNFFHYSQTEPGLGQMQLLWSIWSGLCLLEYLKRWREASWTWTLLLAFFGVDYAFLTVILEYCSKPKV